MLIDILASIKKFHLESSFCRSIIVDDLRKRHLNDISFSESAIDVAVRAAARSALWTSTGAKCIATPLREVVENMQTGLAH